MAKPKISAVFIEKCRERFEAGDGKALLDAIDMSARSGTALPMWAVDAWCSRYLEWSTFNAASLDDAFGVKRPKGLHVGERAARERQKLRVVYQARLLRQQAHERGEKLPIDEVLFARIGKILKIPPGRARDIYYDSGNLWRTLFEKILPKLR
jgi:hypothetical protein